MTRRCADCGATLRFGLVNGTMPAMIHAPGQGKRCREIRLRKWTRQAKQTYLDLSDEAAGGLTRADLDADAMRMADQFAADYGLPRFDEFGLAGLDAALDAVNAVPKLRGYY